MEQNLEEKKQKKDNFFKRKPYKQALSWCTDKLCKLGLYIQSRKIKYLIKLKQYQAALKECNKDFCRNNLIIQSQKIDILMELERYQEALEECNKDFCKNSSTIQSQRKKLDKKEIETCFTSTSNNQNIYLTKLYFDDLTVEEIEAANISAFEKMILKIAFYNKKNRAVGLQYIKTLKRNGTLSTEELKIVNRLYEKLVGKKIFDILFYCETLDGSIDFSYIPNVEKETDFKETSKKKVEQIPIKKEEKKKQQEKSVIVIEGKRISRFDHHASISNKTAKYEEQEKLLKDVFVHEIEEIQKYIYVEMNNTEKQMRAIQAWDNFENLIYRKASDAKAYEYLFYIIEVFKKNNLIKSEELVRERVIKK